MFEAAPKPPRKAGSTVKPWTLTEKLAFEKELLGFYVTGHPLDEYRSVLEGGKYIAIAKLPEQEDKSTVTIAGALAIVERKFTKKDSKPFAIVTLEDLTDSLEVMIWSDAYTKSAAHLVQGAVVQITGRLDLRDEGPRISANELKPIKKPETQERPLVLTLDRDTATEHDLIAIREIIWQNPGERRVVLLIPGKDGERDVRLYPSRDFCIAPGPETEAKLGEWLAVPK